MFQPPKKKPHGSITKLRKWKVHEGREKREEALARKCCREDFLRDKDRNENGWLCWRKRLDAERW
jgi:hypothetical protein